jgi:hypothetical protein
MANIFNSFENLDFNNLLDEEMWGGSLSEILCSSRAFSLSGTPVALRSSRQLVAASGNITLSGTGVTLRCTRKIASSSRQFVLSGTATSLKTTRKLVASSGHVTLLGSPVSVLATRKITNVSGAFTLVGSGIGLSAQRKINTDHGVFNLLGSEVLLPLVEYMFSIVGGNIEMQGHSVALLTARRLMAESQPVSLLIPVYPPFRPLTEEELRTFGIDAESMRDFITPIELLPRLPEVSSDVPARSFDNNIHSGRY